MPGGTEGRRYRGEMGETIERAPRERRLVKARGTPLSEQIIRDRPWKTSVPLYYPNASAAARAYYEQRGTSALLTFVSSGSNLNASASSEGMLVEDLAP